MCGIAGYAGVDDPKLLERMCMALQHRGPDDMGFYTRPDVGLSMRRLSIIDLKTGHQPISNEAGDIWVVFNGEIYNYDDLRRDLMARGHTLATSSDTETIVHLYEDHGLEFVEKLRGMFGIALWDEKRRRLMLIRDRIGEKPLFYSIENGRLFFGSEIKSVLQAIGRRTVNPQAICDFLACGYIGGEGTFYSNIKKLPPGHMLVWEQGQARVQRYWKLETSTRSKLAYEDAREELASRLDETVRLCLKSDVEVGAFLSGGLDSSAIAALMKKNSAEVKTFSVGYGGAAEGFNELSHARKVANFLGTEHHELILKAESSLKLLPKILHHYDEPHGEPTSVLVYLLCEFTRKHVKVALSGTGGDEIFFGYPRHRGVRMLQQYQVLPRALRKHVIERFVSALPESTKGSRFAKRAKRFISGADLPADEAYLTWVSLIGRETRAGLISDRVKTGASDSSGESFLAEYLLRTDHDLMAKVAALDISGYLPEYQLTYVDRMSMANSLEARSPLCDFELVSFVTSLPHSYRLKGDRTKHIFKDVAKRWLPAEITERKKVGFDSPIGQWFKDELREFLLRFLSVENVRRSGLLDPHGVQGMIAEHLEGRRDYSLQLWSIIAIEAWYRMYIEDNVSDASNYSLADLRGAVEISAVAMR